MKKILFVLSVLTLLSYGCNRNEDAATDGGMQREESVNEGRIEDSPTLDSGDAYEDSERGMDAQKEEFRDRDVDVNDSIDDRPNLEEEN